MRRGEIWWADLLTPVASEPGYRRPVLIVQADSFNRSRIRTVVVLAITSNLGLASAPGNLRLSRRASGLPRDSVVNVTQIVTLDRSFLQQRIRRLNLATMSAVDSGMRLVLQL